MLQYLRGRNWAEFDLIMFQLCKKMLKNISLLGVWTVKFEREYINNPFVSYVSLIIHYKCLCYCSIVTLLERETEQCTAPFRGLLNYPVSS